MRITPEFAAEFNEMHSCNYAWSQSLEIYNDDSWLFNKHYVIDSVEELLDCIYEMGLKDGERMAYLETNEKYGGE